jgi:hypothetical protein
MRLEPSFRDISASELIAYLLRASGQEDGDAVNPAPILDLLGLKHLSVDFDRELPEVVSPRGEHPRALLSFPERVIATDRSLRDERVRFSTFHDVGHYVLPEHVQAIVLCTDRDLSHFARGAREQQANAFAAELMFHGARFALEANSRELSARTVKELATRYRASYESTARRLVEKSVRPCMLVVFAEVADDRRIDLTRAAHWTVRYSIPSRAFAVRFFSGVEGSLDSEDAARIAAPDRDIADSVVVEGRLALPDGTEHTFRSEYFYNQYNVLCLMEPALKGRGHSS